MQKGIILPLILIVIGVFAVLASVLILSPSSRAFARGAIMDISKNKNDSKEFSQNTRSLNIQNKINNNLTELGTLGGSYSKVNGINQEGNVVGESITAAGDEHGFVQANDKMVDLGTLSGGKTSSASSLNERKEIVGISDNSLGQNHAILWKDNKIVDLGTLPGGDSFSIARSINSKGQIVGASQTASGDIHAFFWDNSKMTDLGTLGGKTSDANSINDKGQITGYATLSDGTPHAVIWRNGKATDLGTLGGKRSSGASINNSGEVVGYSEITGGQQHAFLSDGSNMLDLGVLQGKTASSAVGINNTSTVIGTSDNQIVSWDHKTIASLPIDTASPTAINDRGTIVGSKQITNGQTRGFIFSTKHD